MSVTQYDEFINAMIDKGIEPVGTLFHVSATGTPDKPRLTADLSQWDTPMNLMLEYGSFADTGDRLVKDFVTYAETMFRRFGNKITKWVTFNGRLGHTRSQSDADRRCRA